MAREPPAPAPDPTPPPAEDVPPPETNPDAAAAAELVAAGVKPKLNIAGELEKLEAERGSDWVPKTRLGRLVRGGEITSMRGVLQSGLPLREPEIVDVLLPDIADDVTSVNMVQRMTDSGRRVRFSIQAVVGNRDGFVGIGMAKGKEVGPTIRKAIDNAKLNVIEVTRGCGSWECGCGTPHTVPFEMIGKSASTEITVKPAPRGVGLAVGQIARKVLSLAGVKDAWGFARGQTRTTVNAAQATFNALERIAATRLSEQQLQRVKISRGPVGGLAQRPQMPTPEAKA